MKKINRKGIFFALLLVAMSVGLHYIVENIDQREEIEQSNNEDNVIKNDVPTETFDNVQSGSEDDNESQEELDSTASGVSTDSHSLQNIPEYSGNAFIVINDNKPFFTDKEKESLKYIESYSDLDELGRCGVAYVNVSNATMPTEERGPIGQIRPSGWHTVKYNDLIDGNYLYNRCHLVGYQLAGENANEKNLITGTRYMNTVGMLEFENQVADYIQTTEHHVLYRVTPVFIDDNLLASGVEIEAWSIEDKGEGVCFNVYCYNVQPGIGIDYSTGESWRLENNTETKDETSDNVQINSEDKEYSFVVNTNTKKFHLPDCSSVSDMKEKNKMYYSGTIEELIEQGYGPCKRCLGSY